MEAIFHKPLVFTTNSNINFQINPEEYGLQWTPAPKTNIDLAQYNEVSELYREALSSTSVSLATLPLSDEKIVIKRIYKEDLKTDFQKRQARQEFPLHCSLDHENIVKGLEWSENDQEYFMLMEFMNNASYFPNKIETNLTPVKNEVKMKSYMVDVLEGLSHLHSKGIVHGDIKLENLLVGMNEDGRIPTVKLADLGLSRFIDKSSGNFYMESPVGSLSYMAPEIKHRSYVDEKIDMWAMGIVMYKMAVAYKPTQIAGYKYGSGPVPFRKFDWKKRSPELQDLVTQMLETDPKNRISAEEALQHPWFQL